jgi:SAM-dependent methyltransferase
VLDLGCGYGEFINNVPAQRKFAMDLNPESRKHLGRDIEFFEQDCSAPWPLADDSLETVFTSNFFEHLPSCNGFYFVAANVSDSLDRAFVAAWLGTRECLVFRPVKTTIGKLIIVN